MKFTTLIALTLCIQLQAQTLPTKEAKRIIGIQQIAEQIKPKYWPEWSGTPFMLLLVDDEYEFLLNHPNPQLFSGESYYDSLLRTEVHFRERTFPTNMAASFPLLDQHPVIVMGNMANSYFDKERWTWTLLHEHFHQFQYSQKDYYTQSKALDLAKDSTDGMWPLNYPFPYDDPKVEKAIDQICKLLFAHLEGKDVSKKYLRAKMKLKSIVSEKDYKYFNFQIWQEGFPRFLEIDLIDEGTKTNPTLQLDALKNAYLTEIKQTLSTPNLSKRKRIIFYSIGAVEWMLITQIHSDWKSDYFTRMFESDYLLSR